ncbi:imm11 family protein [Photobacterium nomapromontoriensis]|uniref:imm11 family protein n=1 Tax=Photobacterium nomapromontoriensis TaxID=2910237 RepID=UPI003D0C9ADA
MKYDSQYYLLCESGHAGFYMLGEDEGSDDGLAHLMALRSLKRDVKGRGKVKVYEGNKAKFTPCDYHEIAEQMVSEKFRQVLLPFNLPGVDFYPTDVTNDDKVWSDYYMMHIWQHHKAIHHGRSVIDGTYVKDDFFLEALSLDETVLDKVPLEERLVFTLEEKPQFLFHETVVEALEAANLSGIGFIRVDEWGPGAMFSDEDFGDL